MVSSVRRIYGELYVIKLGTETKLGGTEMKLWKYTRLTNVKEVQ